MDRRPRQTGREPGHSTKGIIEKVREGFDEVRVENSELDGNVTIRFKSEEDPREPESVAVFTEMDKFVRMRVYFPMHRKESSAEDEVDEIVENLETENVNPDCVDVVVKSDQGETVFRPVVEVTNDQWVNSDCQIDSIEMIFQVIVDMVSSQEED